MLPPHAFPGWFVISIWPCAYLEALAQPGHPLVTSTKVYEGGHSGSQLRVAIVVSQFNAFVTNALAQGAVEALEEAEVTKITIYRCPGAFEIPQLVARVVAAGNADAVVCLGAVIRGDTAHFEYISQAATNGIAELALQSEIPIAFGVLTTETIEQAVSRAQSGPDNKGREAALAVLEMANLFRQIASES